MFVVLKNYFGEGMDLVDWDIEAMTGYKPLSTFYTDFGIAERFGVEAIKDTYETAMNYWASDYKWLTEIVMVLNWKIWEHYEREPNLADLYQTLYEKASKKAVDTLKGEELRYFFRTTD